MRSSIELFISLRVMLKEGEHVMEAWIDLTRIRFSVIMCFSMRWVDRIGTIHRLNTEFIFWSFSSSTPIMGKDWEPLTRQDGPDWWPGWSSRRAAVPAYHGLPEPPVPRPTTILLRVSRQPPESRSTATVASMVVLAPELSRRSWALNCPLMRYANPCTQTWGYHFPFCFVWKYSDVNDQLTIAFFSLLFFFSLRVTPLSRRW